MDVQVYNQQGQATGTMELPKGFESPWNADLVHQVVTSQQANRRRPTAHAKGRGEVRGGGRKPWRQKGTGRARHGSIRSPIWKGGGVTHGPTTAKQYTKKINRKMAARALSVVLSAKVRDSQLVVFDNLAFDRPKTKEALLMLRGISQIPAFSDIAAKPKRALVLLPDAAPTLRKALRNIPALELAEARNVTALDAINRKYVVLPKASVEVLVRRLGA